MAQWEEQLNQILGDPQAMGQIMSLAQSLSGKQETSQQETSQQEDAPQEPADQPAVEEEDHTPEESAPSPLSALSGLDPKLLQMGMGLLSEYSAQDDKKPLCWPPSSHFSNQSGRPRWTRPSVLPG